MFRPGDSGQKGLKMPNGKVNHCNREAFEKAVDILSKAHPGHKFRIGWTWLDYGAGMEWETILCEKPNSAWGEYQLLNPREWDELLLEFDDDEATTVAESISRRIANTGY